MMSLRTPKEKQFNSGKNSALLEQAGLDFEKEILGDIDCDQSWDNDLALIPEVDLSAEAPEGIAEDLVSEHEEDETNELIFKSGQGDFTGLLKVLGAEVKE